MTASPMITTVMTQPECFASEKLMEYLSGWSDADLSAAIELHLQECQKCEQTLSELESRCDPLPEFSRRPRQTQETSSADMAIASAISNVKQVIPPTSQLSKTWEPPPGDIGAYELIRPIGRGGMGSVYLARHRQLKKQVAIKLLPTSASFPQSLALRFQREIRAAGGLSHPSIVNATDAGEHQGTHYLVMEYIDGMDLSRVARCAGRLGFADACEIVRQTASGLSHAHAMGIVHRDIKPSNLMLNNEGIVKILDFGLARHSLWDEESAELTTVGQLMGTLDYMAPEQVDCPEGVDYRADLYSMGATLFRLLCGNAPLAVAPNMSPLAKLRMLATHDVPSLSKLRGDAPEPLTQLVRSMLARSPHDRPASAAHAAELLKPLCAGADLRALAIRSSDAFPTDMVLEQVASIQTHSGFPSKLKSDTPPTVSPISAGHDGRNGNRWKWFLAAASLPLMILAGVFITLETQKGRLVIESDDANVNVKLLRNGAVYEQLKIESGKKETRLYAGKYEVTIDGVSDAIVVDGNQIEVRQGETTIARIRNESKSSSQSEFPSPQKLIGEYRLRVGDEIRLESTSDPSIRIDRVPILPDGSIVVPLLKQPMQASGKTIQALRNDLEVAYKAYIVTPAIDVFPVTVNANASEPLYDGHPLSHWLEILNREKSQSVLQKALEAIFAMVSAENSNVITDQVIQNLPTLARAGIVVRQGGSNFAQAILRRANEGAKYPAVLAQSLEKGDLELRKIVLQCFSLSLASAEEFSELGDWLDRNVFSGKSPELLYDAADFCLKRMDESELSLEDKQALFSRLNRCELLGESYWFFLATTEAHLRYRTDLSKPLPTALEQALTILRNNSNTKRELDNTTKRALDNVAFATAWLRTRGGKHPELEAEISDVICKQLRLQLATENTFFADTKFAHRYGSELSTLAKNGGDLPGLRIVTPDIPPLGTIMNETVLPTLELLSLASQHPSPELLGLVDESHLLCEKRRIVPEASSISDRIITLYWPSGQSPNTGIQSSGNWARILIYLYTKELKKKLTGADAVDVGTKPASPSKSSTTDSIVPKFNGRTLDEWLALLQEEQSSEGLADSLEGMAGLLNDCNSARVMNATLEVMRNDRGIGDEKSKTRKMKTGFDLLRLCAGEGYGKLLADELEQKDEKWSVHILTALCERNSKWLPEHEFILNWLTDPEHKTAVPFSAFLFGI